LTADSGLTFYDESNNSFNFCAHELWLFFSK